MSISLKGITWSHSRGFTSIVAVSQRFSELHPDVEITWEKRSLQEFADAPLENLAKNIASKVKRTRKTVSLEPMNPYERRIIHSALQSDPAVSTHSEGEEPYRKVVVTLKR